LPGAFHDGASVVRIRYDHVDFLFAEAFLQARDEVDFAFQGRLLGGNWFYQQIDVPASQGIIGS
jgi:hypothetical protein